MLAAGSAGLMISLGLRRRARAMPPARVFVSSAAGDCRAIFSCCTVQQLLDSDRGSTAAPMRCSWGEQVMVELEEDLPVSARDLSRVRLRLCLPSGDGSLPAGAVPLSHAVACTRTRSLDCPALWSAPPPQPREVRIGAVVIPVDEHGRVLLTRRAAHMRSFPRAWVFPGGGVDAGESVADAAVRELREETGLHARDGSAGLRLVGLWESCFPTGRMLTASGGTEEGAFAIKGQYLVVYYAARVSGTGELCLQKEETDAAVWLTPKDARAATSTGSAAAARTIKLAKAVSSVDGCGARAGEEGSANTSVSLNALHGIYPNETGQGIAQGHLFALDLLAQQQGYRSAL